MSNDLQLFRFNGSSEVRVIERYGEPWFVAKDVADILGYTNPLKAIRDHCKGVNETFTPSEGGIQSIKIIPERDVYRLIMRSKLPAAEKFEEWVVGEVLPAIRKHGGYLTPKMASDAILDPDLIIRLATDLKRETAERLEKERLLCASNAKIAEDAPKVAFADTVSVTEDTILIRDMARDISSKTGTSIGGTRLFAWLRDNGYLIRQRGDDYNMPTQKSINLGILTVKEGTRIGSSGESHLVRTPKVTGKGQIYFINKFSEDKQWKKTA